jgi:hypothetical protein
MAFKTFVEVGRAVLITTGPETGKLGVIGTSLSSPVYPETCANVVVEIISEKSVPLSSSSCWMAANMV